ncbi:5-oxoprolinase subunit PxpB [Vreelandella olivaria]|uniref:5-oxoprolinase subunit PxpB n=1 Tax=Vreelandella olivaria TaxID=390919 RepID=UPI00201F48C5|nr:5-oxoprolinase subunit PxpB [Halomonas olivaria]
MTPYYQIAPLADQGVLIDCGEMIDIEVNRWIEAAAQAVRAAQIAGVIGIVPTYRSLSVEYDSVAITQRELIARLERLLSMLSVSSKPSRRWRIPVVYGGEFGIDFDDVCGHLGLDRDEFIMRHTAPDYRVFMIGFMPGFVYLGGLDARLHAPRRLSPRTRTPAGSISIGGQQTAISSVEAPSGWHLLGCTPVHNFTAERTPPILIEAGDSVRFEAINTEQFKALQQKPDWRPEWEWIDNAGPSR